MSEFANVEAFAKSQGWVVKYADDGTPNFFFPIPQFKSSDMDSSLPEHIHPMFKINGQYVDRRLIAVYKGGDFNGGAHSIPGVKPLVNLGADALLARIKVCGAGFGPKTVADSGGILLWARKMGWSTIKGNNQYGADYRDGTRWAAGQSITVGMQRVWNGVLYTALVAHTTADENRPDTSAFYWKEEYRVGGVMAPNGENTMTGSGPASWRLGNKPNGIDDLTGNTCDQDYGYRIVGQEIQIIEDNNAADPNCDLSASSAAWKAILPNPNDDGYTLVEPGTAGTLKWNYKNNAITLDTEWDETQTGSKNTLFKDLQVNSEHVPHVPSIMYELGLFPLPGDTTPGRVYHTFSTGEQFPRRGGYRGSTSSAGLGCCNSDSVRGGVGVFFGVRSGFYEELESGN